MSAGRFNVGGSLGSFGPLISAEELRGLLAAPTEDERRHVRVLDIRWYLSGKRGEDEYAAGHLPTAQFVSLDRDLARPKGAGPGRHPLPTAGAFAEVLGRLGITATSRVVVYDDAGGAIAARFWWLMRRFGLPHAAVLDGGVGAWERAGFGLTRVVPAISPAPRLVLAERSEGSFEAVAKDGDGDGLGRRHGLPGVVNKGEVDALRGGKAVLLDARSLERFEGKSEPVDARPGHIPGARSHPFTSNLTAPGGTFVDKATLSERFAKVGVSAESGPIVCYCGSGVTACLNLVALALIGRDDALLYEGSWSDWAADGDLPVAVGRDEGETRPAT